VRLLIGWNNGRVIIRNILCWVQKYRIWSSSKDVWMGKIFQIAVYLDYVFLKYFVAFLFVNIIMTTQISVWSHFFVILCNLVKWVPFWILNLTFSVIAVTKLYLLNRVLLYPQLESRCLRDSMPPQSARHPLAPGHPLSMWEPRPQFSALNCWPICVIDFLFPAIYWRTPSAQFGPGYFAVNASRRSVSSTDEVLL
jgi:hypothetical protein